MKTFEFTNGRNNKLSWMNGKNRRIIGFFSKHGVGSWVKSFDSEHYLKERDRYVVLRLTLPSSSVGISSLTITYELWFSSLQDIYFFTALSFYFTKSLLTYLFIVQTQGYYNTGWFNPKMRSCTAFWLCQQTISVRL